MDNTYLTLTFVLKDGSEVEVEREAYFGFIFAEGFSLKDSLKIKAEQVFFKRFNIEENFDTSEKLFRFLIEDMDLEEEEEELLENKNYQLLTSKIKRIADIKELKTFYRHYDYKEPEYDEEKKETISFKKFVGDF